VDVRADVLIRASLAAHISANILTGFSEDFALLSLGRWLRGFATNAMIVGVLEGFEYEHFKRLYGVTELAMAIGYISAYIAPKPLVYLLYTVASLRFLALKTQRTSRLTLTVSKSVVPIAFSEFFLHVGLAFTVLIALKL